MDIVDLILVAQIFTHWISLSEVLSIGSPSIHNGIEIWIINNYEFTWVFTYVWLDSIVTINNVA